MLRNESGQAMVEAALVLPSMILLLLGAVQLAQLQQARLLADYAAFAAARAGIVMNGDPAKMREAAALAVLPAFGPTDGLGAIARTLLRFKAEEAVLEPFGLQPLRIDVHSPVGADFAKYGQHLNGKELDFDDVRPGATEAALLSLQLRYLFELRVPLANKIIHAAWLAVQRDHAGLAGLLAAARAGRYYLPLQAFYTMRMQSNPYLKWSGK
jgi:TadE-like protein